MGDQRTYICNYCGIEHDASTRSDEHIVPRKLFNSSFVLPDVCGFWNNFFARAFETEACNSTFVREILLELTPASERPHGAVFLGTVRTSRQTTEDRWLIDGQQVLRPRLARDAAHFLTIDAFDDKGERHDVQIRLPFAITAGGTGDEYELARFRERMKKERRQVLDYVTRLARDPTLDPMLSVELQARGLRLREPKAVDLQEHQVSRVPGGPVADILPNEHIVDRSLWTRLYMKIAWCFACSKLGRDVLVGLDGDRVLGYLQGDAVPDQLVEDVRRLDPPSVDLFFRGASIDARKVWVWRNSALLSDAKRTAVPAPVADVMSPFVAARLATEQVAASWIQIVTSTLKRPLGDEHRSHSLSLRTEVRGGQAALVCDLALFGGLLAATVQLTSALPAEELDGFVGVSEVIRL